MHRFHAVTFNVNVNNSCHSLFSDLCNILHTFSLVQVVPEDTPVPQEAHLSYIWPQYLKHQCCHLVLSTLCWVRQIINTHLHEELVQYQNQIKKSLEVQVCWLRRCKTHWTGKISYQETSIKLGRNGNILYVSYGRVHPTVNHPDKRNLPWLNIHLTKSMRARNLAYRKVKRSNKSTYWNAYKRKWNQVANQLKYAKTAWILQIQSYSVRL